MLLSALRSPCRGRIAVAAAGLAISTLLLTGCGGGDSPEEQAARDMTDAARDGDVDAVMDAGRRMADEAAQEITIDMMSNPLRLASFLPERVGSLVRGHVSHSPATERGNILMSSADAEYRREGGDTQPGLFTMPPLTIDIIDAGTMRGMLGMIRSGVNYADDESRVQSFTHNGFHGLESVELVDNTTELQLLIPDRLLVTLRSSELSREELMSALDAIDTRALQRQFADGTLAGATELERTELVDAQLILPFIPESAGDYEQLAEPQRSTTGDGVNTMWEWNVAYTRRPRGATLQASVAHARSEEILLRRRPRDPELIIRNFGLQAMGDMVQHETIDINGHEALLVRMGDLRAFLFVHLGRSDLQIMGPAAPEDLIQLAEAFNLDAIQGLTVTP